MVDIPMYEAIYHMPITEEIKFKTVKNHYNGKYEHKG